MDTTFLEDREEQKQKSHDESLEKELFEVLEITKTKRILISNIQSHIEFCLFVFPFFYLLSKDILEIFKRIIFYCYF